MTVHHEAKRILIWGKTYPELSTGHRETVCTGGCTEDGKPVRLYPVDFRYLAGEHQYQLYQWIQVPVAPNRKDQRPESHKVRADQLVCGEKLGTSNNWADRRAVIFADRTWHFGCIEELRARQQERGQSIGLVAVSEVQEVWLEDRTTEDAEAHMKKLADLQANGDLFGVKQRDLDFVPYRVHMRWRCEDSSCRGGHTTSILDWGLVQLGRKLGKEKARQKIEDLGNLQRYDLRLFMGNMKRYPKVFSCIGLWYPLRSSADDQPSLDLG